MLEIDWQADYIEMAIISYFEVTLISSESDLRSPIKLSLKQPLIKRMTFFNANREQMPSQMIRSILKLERVYWANVLERERKEERSRGKYWNLEENGKNVSTEQGRPGL